MGGGGGSQTKRLNTVLFMIAIIPYIASYCGDRIGNENNNYSCVTLEAEF